MQTTTAFDIDHIRKEFPVLHQQIHGKPLVYFDNAATTQKPKRVVDSITDYYFNYNSNIHRGIHTLAEKATTAFENTRKAVQRFINAPSSDEVIFTTGTTDGINLVAHAYGRKFLKKGDEIIISGMEHHSNIVPWQLIAKETGAEIKVIPVLEDGSLDLDAYREMLSTKTKLVAVVYASNSLGTINPVKVIIQAAQAAGAVTVIDGAQATAHLDIDVQQLGCDFFALSAHKMYGPTGMGVLYGKRELLEKMSPYRGGGEMIKEVTFAETTYNDIPYKFEAGTPNIADVIAFEQAIAFIDELGKENIRQHEAQLLSHSREILQNIRGVRLIGTAPEKVSISSFVVENVHHFDLGNMLDTKGIAVRTGHHCTQPLMDHFHIEGTIRASYAVYNTTEEINALGEALESAINLLNPA